MARARSGVLAGLWASIRFAADRLGVTRNTVYNMIARGELEGEQLAGRLVVRRASLNRALKRRNRATV